MTVEKYLDEGVALAVGLIEEGLLAKEHGAQTG